MRFWLLPLCMALPALAADHVEAPGTRADPAGDIADFYSWHTVDGRIVAVVTFDGGRIPGAAATYDEDVLYGVHIDRDGDAISDHDIWIRFGQNPSGDWGMHVRGLPGRAHPLIGPVETVLGRGVSRAWAGLRDDPFFFDETGFINTLQTATLSFTGADDFVGLNTTAIVLEMPTAVASGGSNTVQMWTTTARK